MRPRTWRWTRRAQYFAAAVCTLVSAAAASAVLVLLTPGAGWGDVGRVLQAWGGAAAAVLGLVLLYVLLLSLTVAAVDGVKRLFTRSARARRIRARLEHGELRSAVDRHPVAGPSAADPAVRARLVDELRGAPELSVIDGGGEGDADGPGKARPPLAPISSVAWSEFPYRTGGSA